MAGPASMSTLLIASIELEHQQSPGHGLTATHSSARSSIPYSPWRRCGASSSKSGSRFAMALRVRPYRYRGRGWGRVWGVGLGLWVPALAMWCQRAACMGWEAGRVNAGVKEDPPPPPKKNNNANWNPRSGTPGRREDSRCPVHTKDGKTTICPSIPT